MKKLFVIIILAFLIVSAFTQKIQLSRKYYVSIPEKQRESIFPDLLVKAGFFNKELIITDTVKQEKINGLSGYWLRVSGNEKLVFSQCLSSFPFPIVNPGRQLECDEYKYKKILTWRYLSIDCLYDYFQKDLHWNESENYFWISDADEEQLERVIGVQFSRDSLSFYACVQLVLQVFNTQPSDSNFNESFFYNEEVNLWTGYCADKHNMGFWVTEKEDYIQLLIHYDISRKYFQKIESFTCKAIKEKDYSNPNWNNYLYWESFAKSRKYYIK